MVSINKCFLTPWDAAAESIQMLYPSLLIPFKQDHEVVSHDQTRVIKHAAFQMLLGCNSHHPHPAWPMWKEDKSCSQTIPRAAPIDFLWITPFFLLPDQFSRSFFFNQTQCQMPRSQKFQITEFASECVCLHPLNLGAVHKSLQCCAFCN